jgi:methionyl-tRNA formyltransferase
VTLPLGGERVKVLRGRPLAGSGAPGQVLRVGRDGVEVAASSGSYLLEEVQPPGRRPMPPRALVADRA